MSQVHREPKDHRDTQYVLPHKEWILILETCDRGTVLLTAVFLYFWLKECWIPSLVHRILLEHRDVKWIVDCKKIALVLNKFCNINYVIITEKKLNGLYQFDVITFYIPNPLNCSFKSFRQLLNQCGVWARIWPLRINLSLKVIFWRTFSIS